MVLELVEIMPLNTSIHFWPVPRLGSRKPMGEGHGHELERGVTPLTGI